MAEGDLRSDEDSGATDAIVDRLIDRAVERGERRRRRRHVATLASMCAFVGAALLALQLTLAPVGERATVILVGQGVAHPVRVVYESQAARPDARVSVVLGEHLELATHPGLRELTFDAPLEQGKNLLELPVRLLDAKEARLDVVFESVAGLKRVQVVVRAAAASLNEVGTIAAEVTRSVS
jgi:hypothetical protein